MKNNRFIIAVTGSIAAYKIAYLTRQLVKAGAEVQILMTKAATDFITPLTLATLSTKPVLTDIFEESSWNSHVELGLWADALIIAPATANTMGKMANGICDNLVLATYLSAKCPVFIAPAMDLDMWKHPSTKSNIDKLISFGNHIIPVDHGELASGLIGEGRMAEPEKIFAFLDNHLKKNESFQNKKVLITAGPTYEPIDPVRFIGNRSSGKMGLALAEALAERGADVKLVLGPSKLSTSHKNISTVKVETAEEMYSAAKEIFAQADIAILAAAVADYRPTEVAQEKIKKKDSTLNIAREKTTDIAASLGKTKQARQIIVGFALETNNEQANAMGKLKKKNFDFIVLNSLKDKGAGFNYDTNKITILHKDNKVKKFELKSKLKVAEDIVDELESII